MQIYIFCGKGGVGKTHCAASFALHLAKSQKTTLIDYDGGHSIYETLGAETRLSINSCTEVVRPDLFVGVVEPRPFQGADRLQNGGEFADYMGQFPDDYGIIPWADMINTFFGVPADVPTLQRFVALVSMLHQMEREGCGHVVIDVEPTAGLQRLLSNSCSTVRSMINLGNTGGVLLTVLGAKWPHIAAYLRTPYMGAIQHYADRMMRVTQGILHAKYILVTTPERSPVSQAFDVSHIVAGFGGSVCGVVVNNVRGHDHEEGNIQRLGALHVRLVRLPHEPRLHQAVDHTHLLERDGEEIASLF